MCQVDFRVLAFKCKIPKLRRPTFYFKAGRVVSDVGGCRNFSTASMTLMRIPGKSQDPV